MSFSPRWIYKVHVEPEEGFKIEILFAFACMCVCALYVDTHAITCVYGLQNTFGVGSRLRPLHRFQGSNSGRRVYKASDYSGLAILPAELSCQPQKILP